MEILFEDNHLIIINKACNEIVQGDKTGDKPLMDIVKEYIKEKYEKPGDVYVGLPHRIDRPTSGIVVFTKTSKALERLNKMFSENQVKKTYWAVVKKREIKKKATLEHYLVRIEAKNKSFSYNFQLPDSKLARLSYEVIAWSEKYMLMEIDLHTGRHHQIRSQLAAIGCPIKGDLKYGFARSNQNAGIHLHARKIQFMHPVQKQMVEVIAPPPEDNLWNEFLKLTKNQK